MLYNLLSEVTFLASAQALFFVVVASLDRETRFSCDVPRKFVKLE